ncbi:hypothetical protein Tco_1050532 [Tanacetum coccineum]
MARWMAGHVTLLVVLIMVAFCDAATVPGIANNPSHATCKDPTYKECHNLVHGCPKFCPNGCTVHCQSCKPICINSTTPSPPVLAPPPHVYSPPPPSPPTYPTPPPQSPPQSPPPLPNPTPTLTPPSPPTKSKCKLRSYPQSCDMPGAVCQDPRFIGVDGITFYFHGKKDNDFCLVADKNLHINGHFIGKRNKNMGRDFTWVQSIGVLFANHKLQNSLFVFSSSSLPSVPK